ncbi:nodulation protein NolG [Saccharospirillum sp. MSK14-1]|uniref:efflux RND transporter permease subunit n=1 Tax=Saccharospirillum sp. MSK14-1 TaxID=1897632 RepID=UPI000D33C3D5|nr:efflux RND transporter permease subunit [Saccharospirillum sp. MSK14-1]PTY37839.1 nodulation protein NolG [Saccharospirillum sp. MSK14-1]
MFLTRISVNQPVFATMIMVAIMVFGFYSYQRLPIEQMPDIDVPVVAVVTSYPGASPEAVENDIIKPIEDSVNAINGIDSIESTARQGQALVVILFDLEVNSDRAAQDVRDRMSTVTASYPDGADDPLIWRFDPAQFPIMSLSVSSSELTTGELTSLTEDTITQRLSIIQGVGNTTVVGGQASQLNVLVDPDKLASFNVGIGQVVSALNQENMNLPAGSIRQGREVTSIQVEGRIQSLDQFLNLIIGRQGGQPVYLGDVATIVPGVSELTSLALLDDEQALAIDIVKTQGANTVAVAEAVREEIDKLEQELARDGVHIEVVRDNAEPVEQSFHTVRNMLIEGAVLAVVIVFLFLNSWRSTVITGLTLPISIIGTMTALHFLGFTLNMMTLLALSLAVGLLIDDAIVVRENIMRHLHMNKDHKQAALDGTNEIGLAVLATTLSIIAVFLPVAFMDGILGRFFLQFGVTVSVAVAISMFVAFTLDPMLSSVWYDPSTDTNAKRGFIGRGVEKFDGWFDKLRQHYRTVLQWSLRHRVITLVIAFFAFIGSFFLAPHVGFEFSPSVDNSEFQVDLETPDGSNLDYTTAKVRQVNAVLRQFPEITDTYTTINAGAGAQGETSATILVSMTAPGERDRTPQQMTIPVREALQQVAGITVRVGAAGGFGGGVTAPVQVNLYGESFTTLERLSDELASRMASIEGITDIESSLNAAQPIIGIRIDREAASDLGVSLQQIGATLRPLVGGEEVTDWTAPNGENHTMVVRLPEEFRSDVNSLARLPISQSGATGSSSVVRLDQVADIVESTGPSEISRMDLSRRVTLSANLAGVPLGDVTPLIQQAINDMTLPSGYRISMGGDAEQLAETAASAGQALLLAIVFIYLVLASQFGSFLQPVAIMASLPLSLIGVMLGLLVGGSTLNIYSIIGFIMLMGLVVKNAILLVDNANQGRKDGLNLYDALVEAGMTRFRPIIMTTLAMIFGMLPLALNIHEGAGQNAPMAHAVIGGLISSTILTLVVVPVVVTYIEQFGHFARRFLPKSAEDHG